MHKIHSQMAPASTFVLALVLALTVDGAIGKGINIECGNLKKDSCAYAVSSVGKRCVLEKQQGVEEYACATSEIEADDKLKNVIESDECIKACGLDRSTLGISSDSLMESHFAANLCSNHCYAKCPNIVDLYFNLAAGEGVYLPKLCEAKGGKGRRELREIKSSGNAAAAESPEYPKGKGVNFLLYGPSPAPAPAAF